MTLVNNALNDRLAAVGIRAYNKESCLNPFFLQNVEDSGGVAADAAVKGEVNGVRGDGLVFRRGSNVKFGEHCLVGE